MKDLADAYAVQEVAEDQVSHVMQKRMGATDAEYRASRNGQGAAGNRRYR
jgi:hypothetical protein